MISVIILTFNSIRFIRTCLDSVFSQAYRDLEVIVVDNGSKDSAIALIRKNYPKVRVIENNKNLGACIARNKGIEAAKGKWVLTLDCDVVLEKSFLKNIMEFAEQSEKSIGMFQPKILQVNRKMIYSCGVRLSKLRRFHDIGKGQPDNGKFNRESYIFGASSAAALYKREMLEEIRENTGYFDERFFFLVEDVDLAWRAQKKGWKAKFCPQAICCHFGNASNFNRKIRQY
ncbi:MAG: glycosyltransferase family 2 protein, partial [Candidatus Omnitrophica bacterium]|nr:glycosyltransferase family 2 protein [Candidatus Omnitrophota bacterium]